jgi:hypothetical protein
MKGYDIIGGGEGEEVTTLESCKYKCNNNETCKGFTFTDGVCYPKSSVNGPKKINSNVNLYTRNKMPITPPMGVSKTVKNVDSILYQNYTDGGELSDEYGLSNATSVENKQLNYLQKKLNTLSSKLVHLTGKFTEGSQEAVNQSQTNFTGIQKYLQGIQNTNAQIKSFDTTIDNILKDSDIVVLQKNYDYLFWSILATGTVLVAINVMHK